MGNPFVSFNPDIDYLGKSVLEKQNQEGVQRSLVGLKLKLDNISITKFLPIQLDGQIIGELRSGCFSPDFGCCLGIAMIQTKFQNFDEVKTLLIDNLEVQSQMTSLPFSK